MDIHEGHPIKGFYRMRDGKDGPWLPVAIWQKDDEWKCRVLDKMRDVHDVWLWCAKNPVKKEDAKHAFENKGAWPGDAPPIGDNSGNLTPLDALKDYIVTAEEWIKKTPNVEDQTACDQAANTAAELTKIKNKANKDREEKVRPHLDAQHEINGAYNPLIKAATDLVKKIKRSTDTFLIAEKNRKEAEERARYEAERKAAEAARKAAEKQHQKQLDQDVALAVASDEPDIPEPKPPEPIKVQAGGQRGKKMSLRTYVEYNVTDYAKALEWAKDKAEVVAAVEKVCKAAARDGLEVPGVTRSEEERAA